jgi:outer membrane protein
MKFAVLAAFLVSTAAHADAPLWELGLGAGVVSLPQYRGADRNGTLALPLPYVVYRGPILKADRSGARATLAERGPFRLNLSAGLGLPVDADENPAREGMPRLRPTLELGPDAVWRLTGSGPGREGLSLHLPLRAAFTLERDPQAVGLIAAPHLQWNAHVGGWNVGVRGGPLFASRRHHAYALGVPASLATAERPAYAARGGYSGLQAFASASRRVGDLWLGAYLQADSLRGSVVAASPLVRRDSGVTVGLGAAWIFARSSRRVATDELED